MGGASVIPSAAAWHEGQISKRTQVRIGRGRKGVGRASPFEEVDSRFDII